MTDQLKIRIETEEYIYEEWIVEQFIYCEKEELTWNK